METNVLNSARKTAKNWWISLLIGLFAVVLGIWCLSTPDSTLVALTLVFIVSFFITGIMEIIYAVSNRRYSDSWGWSLAGGIIDIVFGIILVVLPLPVMTTILVYFIGFWIMFRAILTIGMSFELQQRKVNGWGWVLAIAILSLLLSLFFFISPAISGAFIVIFVSIAILCYGIFRIIFAFRLRSMNKFFEALE